MPAWKGFLANLILILTGVSCDSKDSPSVDSPEKTSSASKATTLPNLGILRIYHDTLIVARKHEAGLVTPVPTLEIRLDYAGPKKLLGLSKEFWIKGQSTRTERGTQSLLPPVSGKATLTLKDEAGVTFTSKFPSGSGSAGAPQEESLSGSLSVTASYREVSMKGKKVWVREPKWPVEVRDEEEATIWTVIVPEDDSNDPGTPLEELAPKAAAAWRFKTWVTDKVENKQ